MTKHIYIKRNTTKSIVNTISKKHIDGYFDALCIIEELLYKHNLKSKLTDAFYLSIINAVSSRIKRILDDRIVKLDPVDELLEKIYCRATNLLKKGEYLNTNKFKTKYEIIFDEFMSCYSTGISLNELLDRIRSLMRKSWSCYDLHYSIFLRPDEIRTCCKRYFVNGQRKGDVVILKAKKEKFDISYSDIHKAKSRLHFEINRNNAPECAGCPFLSFEEWGEPLTQLKYISLEYHSICNMRCVYCDTDYYGGKKPLYDVIGVIKSLAANNKLSEIEHIV